ncbi:MAG: tetratricopeptide repeat protein [Acidimicrobiaceae bacterium]|nr:tetratricopeptide repeat protein [Acidimicrobiaceae bacterium]
MDELNQIIASRRLVTLVGPGGCGKTRLAIEVASQATSGFPGGLAFVDLAPRQDHTGVPESVAAGLGLARQAWADVPELIGENRILLVLDNAEHLLEGVCRLVEEFLRQCPALGILVTSREPLNLDGELSWRVPPLRLPPADHLPPPDQLVAYDAVRLFTIRAVEHSAAFRLTVDNASVVRDICRRLDGIPLALELAAARVPTLGLTEVAARLDDSYRLLTKGSRTAVDRHQTLRAAMEWSYRLLDESERRLLPRLSVFSGSFDLQAVEAVCSDPKLPTERIADVVHSLVNKSLVIAHAQAHGELRYSVMEVLRQYAEEQLPQALDNGVRGRHARYYAGLVSRLAAVPDHTWIDQLSAEYENIQSALEWTTDEDPELLAVTVNSLYWFWRVRGSMREAHQWSLRALGKPQVSLSQRLLLHRNVSVWLRATGRLDEAGAEIDEAIHLLEQVDDVRVSNRIIGSRGVLRAVTGDLAGAEDDFRYSIGMLEGFPVSEELLMSLNDLAMVLLQRGDPERAVPYIERGALLALEMGPLVHYPEFLHTSGAAYLALKRLPDARNHFLRGLEIATKYRNNEAAVALLQGMACYFAVAGQLATCLELLGCARGCARRAGITDAAAPATPCAEAERASRLVLGDTAANEAVARGLHMDLNEALDLARSELGDRNAGSPLTARKLEIVRLVAQGLANKEIADLLSISERTVEAHLEQLRNQLGFRNRAHIAAWAASNGLVSETVGK